MVLCWSTASLYCSTAPPRRAVELVTRKFGADQFDGMLRELTESATAPPFSVGETGAGRYAVSTAPRDEVLYHAFVYLRYILSDRAPEEVHLLPALELILGEPHRLWRSDRRDVRIEALTTVDAHTPLDLVTRTGTTVLPSSLSPSGAWLAERLGGSLPEVVSERKIRSTAVIGAEHRRPAAGRAYLASSRRDSRPPSDVMKYTRWPNLLRCVFRRCRSPVPTSRSPIPEHADHLERAEVHRGAEGSGFRS